MRKRTNSPRRKSAAINSPRGAGYATAGAASAVACAATADADISYSGVIDRHFTGEFSSAQFPLTGGASLIPVHIGPARRSQPLKWRN